MTSFRPPCCSIVSQSPSAIALRRVSGEFSSWLSLPPQAWTARDPAAAKTEAAGLRLAIADADWDTVERHGGLDAVVVKIDQAEEETAASAGAGWIDDFRLRGSSSWRQMTAIGKSLSNCADPLRRQALYFRLSQRPGPSSLWWCRFRKTVTGRGFSRVLTTWGGAAVRGASPFRPAEMVAHKRGESGGSDPLFTPPGAAPGGGRAPSTVIPAGRPSSRLGSRQRKSSRPQMALRPRRARLENAHNPISPIRSTGSLPLHLTASDSGFILG